jgi:hypothetical protein
MLRFRCPKPPKKFAKEVAPARRAVERSIAKGQLPDFPELWRKEEYKRALIRAQHGKCGYCETFALNHPPAIDHHAPKGGVDELVSEGYEGEEHYGARGRLTRLISTTGYHWLAYAWGNWLLVCERCNTGWKGSLFPVREDPHPCPPRPDQPYTPLLLSPFGPEDPIDHLEFSALGEVVARDGSEHGEATIRTLGFHLRESLRRARQGFTADAYRHGERLLQALADDELDKALIHAEALLALGGEERPHAGMVRSIVLSKLELRWPELEALARTLGAKLPSAGAGPGLNARRRGTRARQG